MNSVTVFVKERGRAPSSLPRSDLILEVSFLDVAIPPPVPLQIGEHICVQVLTRQRARDGTLEPGYISESTGIEGEIVGIRTMELAVTEFIVKNEDFRSTIGYAYLSIQHVEGATVHLELWRRALRTFLLPILPHTRHIPLDRDANVTPRSYTPAIGRFRDGLDVPEAPEGQEDWTDEEI